ncbi:MAG: DUF1640 domain-containing protein [Bdellovibrionales bacterium]|nr:DUF1640 domain-containing protein [Bdellovibrionales bacterium]
MTEIIFDALKFKKSLESSGVPPKQAEKHIEIMSLIINSKLTTKEDLKTLEISIRHDTNSEFTAVRSEMKSEFAVVRAEMANLKNEIIIEVGKLLDRKLTIAIGIIAALDIIFKLSVLR